MTDIVSPPAIEALPPEPLPTDTPAEFNTKSFNLVAALKKLVAQMNAALANVWNNATAAHERAGAAASSASAADGQANAAMGYRNSAASSATAASGSASSAATSAGNAAATWAALQKRDLGPHTSPPTTDNLGQPIQLGAWYTNPTDGSWYWWNGAWVFGRGDPASVDWSKVLNKPTTVAGLALSDFRLLDAGNVDLNTIVVSGDYRITTGNANAPAGTQNCVLSVHRVGDVIWQKIVQPATGRSWERAGSGIGGSAVWTPWTALQPLNETPVEITGGVMDCARASNFTVAAITGGITLSFANIPAGAYSCMLEVYLASGSIVLPAATLLNEPTPPIVAGKRYLIFFQKSSLVGGRWFASVLQFS